MFVKSVINFIVRVTRILFCCSCWRRAVQVPTPRPRFSSHPTAPICTLTNLFSSHTQKPASCKSEKKSGYYFSAAMIQSYPLKVKKKKSNKWATWQEKLHQAWVMSACLVCSSPATRVLEDLWHFSRLWLNQCLRISWSLSTPALPVWVAGHPSAHSKCSLHMPFLLVGIASCDTSKDELSADLLLKPIC